MRIAYISFEHPAGIAGGGIGSYLGQISRLMSDRGHEVEVFAATHGRAFSSRCDGYLLHLITAEHHAEFREKVLPAFSTRQSERTFDLIESAEYGADALLIKKKFPALPLVLKLHTPQFLMSELNAYKRSPLDILRFIVSGLLRFQRIKAYWRYDRKNDPEFELYRLADGISSPSRALAAIVAKEWGGPMVDIVPYPYRPAEHSNTVARVRSSGRPIVNFIGRLERRKGIFVLMKAIPSVLERHPSILFRFIGESVPSPRTGQNMDSFIRGKLSSYRDALQFTGRVSPDKVIEYIREARICVFPSLWENFPNVCLEAMAEGSAVIGTDNGGMADMINSSKNGFLIPAGNAVELANAICRLVEDPTFAAALGKNAQNDITTNYNGELIGELTEAFYERMLNR